MKYVEEYIYLCQLISFEDRGNKEVIRRINSTWNIGPSKKYSETSKLTSTFKENCSICV